MAQTDRQTVFERRILLSIIGRVKVNNLSFTARPTYSEINQKQSTKVARSKDTGGALQTNPDVNRKSGRPEI